MSFVLVSVNVSCCYCFSHNTEFALHETHGTSLMTLTNNHGKFNKVSVLEQFRSVFTILTSFQKEQVPSTSLYSNKIQPILTMGVDKSVNRSRYTRGVKLDARDPFLGPVLYNIGSLGMFSDLQMSFFYNSKGALRAVSNLTSQAKTHMLM